MERHYSSTSFQAVRPCVVGIETKTGSRYTFPDMSRDDLFKVLGPQLLGAGTLTLVNISGACLTVPLRIISAIAIDDEVAWRSTEPG